MGLIKMHVPGLKMTSYTDLFRFSVSEVLVSFD